jgi:hypothetical protein
MKISREVAIAILKYCHEHPSFYFPFLVMCQEYTPEDDDFVEIEPEEWEMIQSDDIYQTFELWENLQNLDTDTVPLMAKGFLDMIIKERNEEICDAFDTINMYLCQECFKVSETVGMIRDERKSYTFSLRSKEMEDMHGSDRVLKTEFFCLNCERGIGVKL